MEDSGRTNATQAAMQPTASSFAAPAPGPTPVPAVPQRAATTPVEPPGRPPLNRERDGSWVAGVASGLANHLGLPVWLVRGGFVALGFTEFIGVFVYGALWVLMPTRTGDRKAPGVDAATRTGKRRREIGTSADLGVVSGLAIGGVGMAWLAQALGWGLPVQVFWPLAFAAAGLALVWRQADDADLPVEKGTSRWLAPFVQRSGWLGVARMVLGIGLVGASLSIVVASSIGLSQLPAVLLLTLLLLGGIALVTAPWIHRWRRSLAEAHEQRLLSDARADMAAHLHDSVLQTLALIQRQSSDPQAVASLARRQERELRAWLYEGVEDDATLKAALTRAAQEVEDERGVPVELVVVGDADLTSDLSSMVSAAREAIMNAAKHSGAATIDVFAEVEDGRVEIFVRDRGKGFDMSEIADDRMGVKNSIIARMERRGGAARIRSAPGEGTDIKLEMEIQ